MPDIVAAPPPNVQISSETASGMQVLKVLTYATAGDLELRLDVYRPAGEGPFPGVVIVHGGGWGAYIEHTFGGGVSDIPKTKERMAEVAKRFASEGFVAIPIEYVWACSFERVPPNAPTPDICGFQAPAQNIAVDIAMGWIRDSAAALHLDPTRVGELGIAAGGQLALMNAATGENRPKAVATWSAITDLKQCKLTKSCQPVTAYIGHKLQDRPDLWDLYSPLAQATRDMPPSYLANGAHEVSALENAILFRNRLEQLGVPVTLRLISDPRSSEHHGVNLAQDRVPSGKTVFDETIEFFRRHL